MLAKEIREFYYLEVKVKTPSVTIENIRVKFKEIVLSNGDDTVTITNRRCVYNADRTTDGFRVKIYILNDTDDTSKRIDYLIDDDYEIETLGLDINSTSSNKTYEFEINENIGEQIKKKVDIEVSEEVQKCLTYISESLESEELVNFIYARVSKDEKMIKNINAIADIAVI